MKDIPVSSLLWKDMPYSVPSTVEEYNGLAPKRANPVLEDANSDIVKHKVLSKFRGNIEAGVFKAFEDEIGDAYKRINSGTKEEPKWERDAGYSQRVMAAVLTAREQDPADAGAQNAFSAETFEAARKCLSAQPFTVAAREPSVGGGAVAKTYLAWADGAVEAGNAEELLGKLNTILGRNDAITGDKDTDVDTIARAIALNEKRKRDEQMAAAKSEYGIDEPTPVDGE